RLHERFALPRTVHAFLNELSAFSDQQEQQADGAVREADRSRCYNRVVILAIETSCDDTCAAIVEPDGRRVLSNVVHTQTEHARYGGVVPEVASRAHLERLDGGVLKALADAD